MSQPPPPGTEPDEAASRARLVAELEQRIEEIEGLDDSALGSFTLTDWIICVVGGVLVPALALWQFAP